MKDCYEKADLNSVAFLGGEEVPALKSLAGSEKNLDGCNVHTQVQ